MLQQKDFLEILNLHRLGCTVIKGVKSLGGGCSDYTLKIQTDQGNCFLKYYSKQSSEVEAKGLELLRSTKTVNIPGIIGYGVYHEYDYLLLEWIEQGNRKGDYWSMLGHSLAALHKNSGETYGLDYDNYIGRLPQINSPKKKWVDFFIENRLEPQLKLARKTFSSNEIPSFDHLFFRLANLIPEDVPALLHGDLWSGNVMVNSKGEPILIDPAVYYGNREVEIAFTKLFGGFPDDFYDSYNLSYPLEKGIDRRIDLYNLYPLLVHVNMFGRGYVNQVKMILKSFD